MGTMSNVSTFRPEDVLLLGDAQPIIGTAMLGDDFGKIKKLDVERTGDEEELSNGAGSLRGHITKKPGVSADFEVFFDAGVNVPGLYTIITIPAPFNIACRVMSGIKVTWDDGKERGMSFKAQMWDSLIGKAAYRLDTITGLRYLLDIGIPVPAATPGSGQVVIDWGDVADADSYEVQVSADAGVTWAGLATPTPSTYTHTLTTGQTRHYRVRAVSTADGGGEWSVTVNATAGA